MAKGPFVSLDFKVNYATRYEVDETKPAGRQIVKTSEYRMPAPDMLDRESVELLRTQPGDFA